MSITGSEPIEDGNSAPSYHVPSKRIVSIEHPCIVKNFDNGFKSLGGEHHLKHVLEHEVGDSKKNGSEPVAVASLRPSDPFAQKLSSTAITTNNVLVRVTLPRRTGRKRKRGSDEPYESSSTDDTTNNMITAPELLERLRDNAGHYTMQALGFIENTHRFQSLPDFQLRAEDIPIMREIRDRAMSSDYDKLKRFRINCRVKTGAAANFPGPPTFIPSGRSYQYEYKQAINGNRPRTKNKGPKAGISMFENGCGLDSDTVPQGPPAVDLRPGPAVEKMVEMMNSLLARRPIVTLRAAASIFNSHHVQVSFAVQGVGYYVTKGPWEGTIVKYGIDPRTDPKYRIYQTLQFNFDNSNNINSELNARVQTNPRHIFDGKELRDVGKYWQLCDLTDPTLATLVNSPDVREQCESTRWGWYKNGTYGKLRVIMREKMLAIIQNKILITESGYNILASLPSRIDNEFQCDLPPATDLYVQKMAKQVAKEAINGPFKHDRRLRIVPGIGGRDVEDALDDLASEENGEESQDLDLEDGIDELNETEGEEEGTAINGDTVNG